MRNYVERAKDFIEQLFPFIDKCEDVCEYRNAVANFNESYTRKVECANGLARVAFITSDYVVKYEYDKYEVGYIGGCENEMMIYAIAEEEGFSSLFAEITRYEYNGKLFYIMPRIRGVGKDAWNYANAYMTEEEDNFCHKYRITDLHCNNYGFRNGHVCLIDYACSKELLPSSSERSSYP